MPKSKKKDKTPKGKKPEQTIEQKLLRKLEKEKQPPLGPMLTSPGIFPHLIGIVKQYLTHNQFSEPSRHFIAGMAFEFRKEALKRFGHDTLETFELAKLLKIEVFKPIVPTKDVLTHIMKDYPPTMRLDVYQQTAAEKIQGVWYHFGRASGLFGGGRNLMRSNGSGKVLHAVESMSQDDFKHYREVYSPWYTEATKIQIDNSISVALIIFKVLIEDIYPENLDRMLGFKKGRCHQVLRKALSHYLSPGTMRRAILAPPKAKQSPKAPALEAIP
jgi:hypothetical protein